MGIITGRIHGWQTLVDLVEIASAAVLYGLMLSIWQDHTTLVHGGYGIYLLLVVGTLLVCNSWIARQRTLVSVVTEDNPCRGSFGKGMVVALVWLSYLVAFRDQSVSRTFLFTYLVLLPPGLLTARLLANRWLVPIIFNRKEQFGVLILGNPSADAPLLAWLKSKQAMGIEIVGYLSPSSANSHEISLPHLGSIEDLTPAVKRTQAQLVVALSMPTSQENADGLRAACDRLGVRLAYHCNLGGATSRVSICQSDGVSLLSVRSEPLQNPFNRLVKRALDLIVAVPVVLLVLPCLCALVWIIHRFRSPGPLFFRQKRGGLGGRPFNMFKFRTMHCQPHDETVQATHRDKRVFRGGHWLRKFSIDEFPQFLNVLIGDMSLVGPRPHLEAHDETFSEISPEYRVRSLIKPGITGLAQVEGHRGPTPESSHIEARVRADVHYLENWTLTLDLMVVLRTFLQFIRPKNAV